MALDVDRWLQYAKARLARAVGDGNRSLDRLEAEREVELADKPWLRSDGEAPTLDEARARIEYETERQHRAAAAAGTAAEPDDGAPSATGPRPPQDIAADAELEAARLELDRREQASAARLRQIRDELGVDEPVDDDPPRGSA